MGIDSTRTHRLRTLVLLLLPLFCLGAVVWLRLGSAPPEPSYQGRKLSYWLELMYGKYPPASGHTRIADYKSSYAAVKEIGTNAIPSLLFMLRATNSQSKIEFHKPTDSLKFVRIQKVSAEDMNAEAARGFQCLGANAKGAVPAISKIYEARLSEASERWSSYALGAMGPCASAAVPALLRGATNASPQSRKNSLIALTGMHAEPELTVAALTNAFTDPDPDVRKWACNRFGLLGKEAWAARARALPALQPLLRDPDQQVRQEAAHVLTNAQSQF